MHLAERARDGFEHGVDRGVGDVDRLHEREGRAHAFERFVATFEVRALGPLDAMEHAHRLGDRLRDLHQRGGHVRRGLKRVERGGEPLTRGFC